jgi:hypothetical protein
MLQESCKRVRIAPDITSLNPQRAVILSQNKLVITKSYLSAQVLQFTWKTERLERVRIHRCHADELLEMLYSNSCTNCSRMRLVYGIPEDSLYSSNGSKQLCCQDKCWDDGR